MKKHILLILIYLFPLFIKAQDSIVVIVPEKKNEAKFPYKQLIVPTGLIAAGIVLKIPSVQENVQRNTRGVFGEKFKIQIDNYTQYFPAVLTFTGNYLGFQSQHNYRQMATNIAVSSLITGSLILVSKKGFGNLRPDQSSRTSYPSGHSALAFNLATIQFLEYKDSNIWYASSGYLFAATTAVLRVANNRHWSGDVITGAGLGIAVGVLVNYWSPFSKLNSDKVSGKKFSVTGYPMIDQNAYGVGVLININNPKL
jgi:hypothetical protein